MSISLPILKTLLVSLLFLGVISNGSILKLDEQKFDIFTKESEKAIVIMYEEWCGFSEKALHIFKQLTKNPKFTQMDISVGLLDLHDIPEFK